MVDQTGFNCRLAAREMIDAPPLPTKRAFHPTCDYAIVSRMILPITFMFLLGIGNFALHRAVLGSGHPLLGQMPNFVEMLGGRLTLVAEFLVLLTAMLLVAHGWSALVWVYAGYTALNGVSAWMILSGRI